MLPKVRARDTRPPAKADRAAPTLKKRLNRATRPCPGGRGAERLLERNQPLRVRSGGPAGAMSIDPRKLREALGCFATGVTIVTARSLDGELLGITANSFNSVSLNPPLVLFSLDRRAYSLRKFEECGRFAVNILGEEQRDASATFATPLTDKFSTVRYAFGRTGSPVLEDAIAVFDCSIRFRYDGGDHVIFVGEVIDLIVKSDGRPLLYFRGRYRALDGDDPT